MKPLGPKQHRELHRELHRDVGGVRDTRPVREARDVPATTTTATTTAPVDAGALKNVLGGEKVTSTKLEAPPLPSRRLPNLREAIADASVTPLQPGDVVKVPPEIIEKLKGAKRVLVVSHVPPDGDCVGSALGLAQALKALGKDAVAVVDDDLPAQSRAIDAGGDVEKLADVVRKNGGDVATAMASFDCVVIVDVASAARVGGVGDALAYAKNVVVIDHHEVPADHEVLGLSPGATLTTWIDPQADAAAVLVAGVAAHLAPGNAAPFAAAKHALAMAMYTDTLGFKAPGADMKTLRLFKGVVGDVNALAAAEQQLSPQLPAKALALLDGIAARVNKKTRVPTLVVTHDTLQAALSAAHESDPRANIQDVRGHLAERIDALRDKHGAAVLLIDEGALVRVSLRSGDDGFARDTALTLGGGGHPHSAATVFPNTSIDDAVVKVTKALEAQVLQKTAQLRLGRS
jgi:phosphoesterase RecJ-like protein